MKMLSEFLFTCSVLFVIIALASIFSPWVATNLVVLLNTAATICFLRVIILAKLGKF